MNKVTRGGRKVCQESLGHALPSDRGPRSRHRREKQQGTSVCSGSASLPFSSVFVPMSGPLDVAQSLARPPFTVFLRLHNHCFPQRFSSLLTKLIHCPSCRKGSQIHLLHNSDPRQQEWQARVIWPTRRPRRLTLQSIIITSCIHSISFFGIQSGMRRMVRTERDEPMRSQGPNMCFVRNENGNMIPGEKVLCCNVVTHSFQNMKNKFTLQKEKKNGCDRPILPRCGVSPPSLCIKDPSEQARLSGQQPACAHCHRVCPLLTGHCFLTQM